MVHTARWVAREHHDRHLVFTDQAETLRLAGLHRDLVERDGAEP